MALRAHKELELKVHDSFYKNVNLLTFVYPTSNGFKNVFKTDMFLKNNKDGFQHVIYYLLKILNPEKIKEKVPSWPIVDKRMESQFRNEVMVYVNELNSLYEHADLPHVVASHFISPGGFKFILFMLKLSQLVIYEHLQQKGDPVLVTGMLMPIKVSKQKEITAGMLKMLNNIVNDTNVETKKVRSDTEKWFDDAKLEADEMPEEQQKMYASGKANQEKLEELKKHLVEDPELNTNTFIELEEKLKFLNELKENLQKCEKFNSTLGGGENKLEYNKDLNVPQAIGHLVRYQGGSLDFTSLFDACNMLVENKRLEMTPTSSEYLQEQTHRFIQLNKKLEFISNEMNEVLGELSNFDERLRLKSQENGCEIESKAYRMQNFSDSCSSGNSTLAVPLPPTP